MPPQYTKNNQQQSSEEEKPKIDYIRVNNYLRATAERDLDGLNYIVHANTISILLGNANSEEDIQRLLKNNYSALLSLISLDNVNVELDLGTMAVPLTIRLLKQLSGFSL